jgi:hypothetical protein
LTIPKHPLAFNLVDDVLDYLDLPVTHLEVLEHLWYAIEAPLRHVEHAFDYGHGQRNDGFSWRQFDRERTAGAGNGSFSSLFDLVFIAFLDQVVLPRDKVQQVGDLGHEILIGDGLDGLVGEGFENGDEF